MNVVTVADLLALMQIGVPMSPSRGSFSLEATGGVHARRRHKDSVRFLGLEQPSLAGYRVFSSRGNTQTGEAHFKPPEHEISEEIDHFEPFRRSKGCSRRGAKICIRLGCQPAVMFGWILPHTSKNMKSTPLDVVRAGCCFATRLCSWTAPHLICPSATSTQYTHHKSSPLSIEVSSRLFRHPLLLLTVVCTVRIFAAIRFWYLSRHTHFLATFLRFSRGWGHPGRLVLLLYGAKGTREWTYFYVLYDRAHSRQGPTLKKNISIRTAMV